MPEPLQVMYAYRRKADGKVYWHGARPYVTKGAAKNGVRQAAGLHYRERTVEEMRNTRLGRYYYRSSSEMDAILAAGFELVTYELREAAPGAPDPQ